MKPCRAIPCIKSARTKRKAESQKLQHELCEIDEELQRHLRHPDRGVIDNVTTLRVSSTEVDFIKQQLEQRSMRVQQQGYPKIGWPTSTLSRCWWCRGRVKGPPCIMPCRFNAREAIYECEGFFDSWSCVMRYMMEHGVQSRLSSFLRQVLHLPGEIAGHIVAAPHWKLLKIFGGHLTRVQFQKLLTRGITIDVYTKMVQPLHTVMWTSVYARLHHLRSGDASTQAKAFASMDAEDGSFFAAKKNGPAPGKIQTRKPSHHPREPPAPGADVNQNFALATAAARFRVSHSRQQSRKSQSSLDKYLG